jgi:hypothetical protein
VSQYILGVASFAAAADYPYFATASVSCVENLASAVISFIVAADSSSPWPALPPSRGPLHRGIVGG